MASSTESPSKCPATADADSNSQTQEAFTLLAQGKRHLLVKDYPEAVSSLGQACTLLAAKFGETANECGDAYLFYGRALLELARTESEVLGDAIEGEDQDSSEEEASEEDGEGEEKSSENGVEESGKKEEDEKEEKTVANGKGENGHCDKLEAEENTEETETKENEKEEEESEEKPALDESKLTEDSDEDVSNLKLAWEMLEMAKLIFQRQPTDKQISLKLSEVFLRLGEVSLESETYAQAIEDIQQCLQLQKEHLEPDDRHIAESYYQLGMAYSLNNEFDESIKQYSNSLQLLERRVKNLKSKEASGDVPQETDAFYTLEGEVKELQEIIPEIRDKIAEMRDMKVETMKAVSAKLSGAGDGAGSSKSDAGTQPAPAPAPAAAVEKKPVTDISHLVRKKRKGDAEETTTAAEDGKGTQPAKVAKSE